MYKAVCTQNGAVITELTGSDIIDAALKVDAWLADHPNTPVTWHISRAEE